VHSVHGWVVIDLPPSTECPLLYYSLFRALQKLPWTSLGWSGGWRFSTFKSRGLKTCKKDLLLWSLWRHSSSQVCFSHAFLHVFSPAITLCAQKMQPIAICWCNAARFRICAVRWAGKIRYAALLRCERKHRRIEAGAEEHWCECVQVFGGGVMCLSLRLDWQAWEAEHADS